jgi:enamine deaminase RidA (YjgF/YER057c/UK114 family)
VAEAGSSRRFLSPSGLPPPAGYSHVVDVPAHRVVFVSGQVPLDADGQLVGESDFAAQTRQVFANLTTALEAGGATWRDVVKLSYFLRDASQIVAVRAIRDDYVDTERPPASTLIEVSRLFRDDILIEIDAIAVVD